MDIRVIKSWASPSTLHLRVMVTYKSHLGTQFADVHCPLDLLPEDLAALISVSKEFDVEPGDQPTLL